LQHITSKRKEKSGAVRLASRLKSFTSNKESKDLISLLNRISRGIEDAWTAGFIQLFVLILLAYGVANNIVSAHNNAESRIQVEEKYNRENHTDIHLDEPPFDLRAELWSSAVPIIIMTFIIAYEIRRRIRLRAARRITDVSP